MDIYRILIEFSAGIGIFLLGMVIMTEGLRSLAGNAIRSALMRFTKTPLTGALTGAVSTAILQSSSATTVTAVGFVGAELITFPEALGIIFGANIGTTFKGWLIAILGFKLNLINIFSPLLLIGALIRLLFNGKIATIGYTLSGFCLIFIGINLMQDSMTSVSSLLSFEKFAADNLYNRLLLVAIGILFSAITQSSSAGVVATLTALFADIINFKQAAAIVIGMDVGTTVTAAMATIGGSVASKRTGFSHVIYNMLTAIVAFFLITPFALFWNNFLPGEIENNAEIALVAFHTCFNTLGVIIVLPYTKQFARIMENLIPEKVSTYTEKLDESLLTDTALALNAVQSTIKKEFLAILNHIELLLSGKKGEQSIDLNELQRAINETQNYLDNINIDSTDTPSFKRFVNILHAMDHLQRLYERCEEQEERAVNASEDIFLEEECTLLVESIRQNIDQIHNNSWNEASKRANETSEMIHNKVRPLRESMISKVAKSAYDINTASNKLDSIRWLRRASKHIDRIILHYLYAINEIGKRDKMKIKI